MTTKSPSLTEPTSPQLRWAPSYPDVADTHNGHDDDDRSPDPDDDPIDDIA